MDSCGAPDLGLKTDELLVADQQGEWVEVVDVLDLAAVGADQGP